ncbi:MAG: MBL fold metallo-hydrolase [Opitutae bacterium]|nr:MBL fold metallo-hydrolase [Opitutae bacterium]
MACWLWLSATVLLAQDARPITPAAMPGLDVTYIAHEGFMVGAAGKKVVVDVLFDPKFAAKVGPSSEVLSAIQERRAPFNAIDLMLITHNHSDHFHAPSTIAFLRSNPQCRLVAHTQVVDLMRPLDGFAQVEPQIREIKMEAGAREQVALNGVTVDVLCLLHEHRPQIVNLAFVVEMGGARFLHMGDAFFAESETHLRSYPFEQIPTDLLFLNQYDRYGKAQKLIAERIKPAHLVGMHVYPDDYAETNAASRWSQVSIKLRAAFPNISLFEKSMERRLFTRQLKAGSARSPVSNLAFNVSLGSARWLHLGDARFD